MIRDLQYQHNKAGISMTQASLNREWHRRGPQREKGAGTAPASGPRIDHPSPVPWLWVLILFTFSMSWFQAYPLTLLEHRPRSETVRSEKHRRVCSQLKLQQASRAPTQRKSNLDTKTRSRHILKEHLLKKKRRCHELFCRVETNFHDKMPTNSIV